MKKLLLTLGTVAAVAAPVASVVACGTTKEIQTPEFQELKVAGLTFNADAPNLIATDLKGFVYVTTGTTGEFIVPSSDVKITNDDHGKIVSATIVAKSPSAAVVTAKITAVKTGKFAVVATKAEVAKINAGKAGAVESLDSETKVTTFLTKNSDFTSKLDGSTTANKQVADPYGTAPKISEQLLAVKDVYNSYFKA